MPRPITLFTGQWADLPFEEVCGLAASWGYDGVEIACSGDHFDVQQAIDDENYIAGRKEILERHGLQVFAISNHLVGQAICDNPIDFRHQAILPSRVWGDGTPEGVRQRAAEDMKNTARAAAKLGVKTVIGFTGSSIWQYVAMFPPVPASAIEAGYKDFADRWNPILDVFDEVGVRFAHEVHPSEIAYDYWTTVLTLEAIGHREAFGLNWDPSHMVWQDIDPARVPLGLQGPDLPRRLQGHPDAGRRRTQRPPRLPPAVGRPAPRLGLLLDRPRRRELGGLLPRPQLDRLRRPDLGRMGRRRHGAQGRRRRSRQHHPSPRLRQTRRLLRRRLRHGQVAPYSARPAHAGAPLLRRRLVKAPTRLLRRRLVRRPRGSYGAGW
ncbi:sugar phosphate isomerase/epimerase family protein [Kribbella qitaiheensis]|uniref:sugar phosphate isomerase/epimerase family protein n=1 Tax=Kribbella qitaiheensis TaxID=1544730 RepID=UPI003D189EB8